MTIFCLLIFFLAAAFAIEEVPGAGTVAIVFLLMAFMESMRSER